MLIHHDDDEWEPVSERRICPFHQENPGKSYAGCTCMSSYGLKRRDPADVAKIKADRRRQEEDEILRRAEVIKAMRQLG